MSTIALAEMTLSMLERTAMVLAESVDPSSVAEPGESKTVRIDYRGPTQGSLYLAAHDPFLQELAAGLLGSEPADVSVEREGCDALREMANMVAGSIILALSGDICTYHLGLPSMVDRIDDEGETVRCAVKADSGVLHATWVQRSAA